jgi:hypothetical protein
MLYLGGLSLALVWGVGLLAIVGWLMAQARREDEG